MENMNNKNFLGYEIGKDKVKLTNEKVFTQVGATEEDIKQMYDQYKDCYLYSKAVKVFNEVYNNELLKTTYQSIITDQVNYTFDITLVEVDTYLLYNILIENKDLLATKNKTNCLTDKIKPKTNYTKQAVIIELAMKHIKLLDDKTRKQVIAIVMQTINDANIIESST